MQQAHTRPSSVPSGAVSFRLASVLWWRESATEGKPRAGVVRKRPFEPTHKVEESG